MELEPMTNDELLALSHDAAIAALPEGVLLRVQWALVQAHAANVSEERIDALEAERARLAAECAALREAGIYLRVIVDSVTPISPATVGHMEYEQSDCLGAIDAWDAAASSPAPRVAAMLAAWELALDVLLYSDTGEYDAARYLALKDAFRAAQAKCGEQPTAPKGAERSDDGCPE
ncbi:MAG TPA: hypothetical protein VM695_10060 [Phycisphaerae bacterium]|nr:hypothetical protein [Phycisphaerae bacterium]